MAETAERTSVALGEALIEETRRRLFRDSVPRIHRCLSLLSEEEIWLRPNDETVSVGNLVLHLCGNVRQNVVSVFGGAPNRRRRAEEFSERGPIPRAELLRQLDELMAEAAAVLDRIDPGSLLERHRVQGYVESGLSILVHVIEHFSYHVGQIGYFVKSRKAVDLEYYKGIDLNVTD